MHFVNKAVGFVDSPGPIARPLELQWLWLADAAKRV